MVVPAVGVVRVHVVASVGGVLRVEGLHAHAALLDQVFLNILEASESMLLDEELRSISHSYTQVGPQLVLCVPMRRPEHILVYASSLHQFLLYYEVGVI